MEADEALARALQQEEVISARAAGRDQVFKQLEGCMGKVTRCEDELLQALALSVLPLEALHAEANDAVSLNASLGEPLVLSHDDLLVQRMLHWFKHSFFHWTDKPPCCVCGKADTQLRGAEQPTNEERQGDASRTEVYTCNACNALTRFPRFNDPGKLLETRTGRCGEFSNCFLLFLRAAKLQARYILDVTDHVWCEYWSARAERWVHIDPCEAAFDKPLTYEAGWGKALSYVFAVHTFGVTDVIRRYTRNYSNAVAPRRTALPESELSSRLAQLNARLRAGLPREVADALQICDLSEQMELLDCSTSSPTAEQLSALPGRTTGSMQWRQERGEMGAAGAGAGVAGAEAASASAAPSVAAGAPTSYASARDIALGPAFAAFGRVAGGAVRAAGENAPSESPAVAFDGCADSKWLDFGAAGPGGSSWLEYRLLVGMRPVAVAAYDVVAAADCPERDPRDWVLEGGCEPAPGFDVSWTPLHEVRGTRFSERGQLKICVVPRAHRVPCTRFRLRVTATASPTDANSLQLSCLSLYTDAALPQSATSAVPVDASPADAAVGVASALVSAPSSSALCSAPASSGSASVSSPAPSGGGGQGGGRGSLPPKAVAVLDRLLSNIVGAPDDARFRRVRTSKLPPELLSCPASAALLFLTGFRPLLLKDTPAAARADEFLVHTTGEEYERAVVAALGELRRRVPQQAELP